MGEMIATFARGQVDPAPAPASLRSVSISGPAGRLEALLNEGASDAAFAALVCHPHPLYGGTLHNKVVYHAMKALNDPQWGLGWPVLRFNFRGAGLSGGAHHGSAEADDVLAALDWLENEYKIPLVVVGFSFGAAMTLQACCGPASTHRQLRALAALGLPIESATDSGVRRYQYPTLHRCTLPKLFLSGDSDPFAPSDQLAALVASAAQPRQLVLLSRADHFFTGQLEAMQNALAGWLKEQLP